MPWQTESWERVRDDIINAPMGSIVAMDTKIAAQTQGKIRPRQISNCFNAYFETGNVSQEKFVNKIIPMMQQLLSNAPRVFSKTPVYVLGANVITNVALNRVQCATLITCGWGWRR